ncbi:MAG: HupE/UreJ family protein [Flavobacteriales bacterium]|jgi:hypothetical protein|nr:HupE/UreJ family protein [Flavobacteriales bacterium]
MFATYLQLGFEHITDLNGYDHMLFLLALCAAYRYSDWKKILVLVTAFTVGHSITLALSVLNIIPVNSVWIEFLIPVTILATAINNLFSRKEKVAGATYLMALAFGLIHGMGFSNYLRSLLGDELLLPLLSFNLGIELGQLLVVVGIFLLQFAIINTTSVKHITWNRAVSLVAGAVSLLLVLNRLPF